MSTKVYELIRQHECKGDFTHAVVTEGMLDEAEGRLNLKIPKDYSIF